MRDFGPRPGKRNNVTARNTNRMMAAGFLLLMLTAHASADKPNETPLKTEFGVVEIDCDGNAAMMEKFWNHFGFSPAWNLFKDHYKVYMAYAGSVPHDGLQYVRIHRTLNLIGAERDGNEIVYDWSKLDKATDILMRYGLKHHFEFDYKGRGSSLINNSKGAADLEAARHHRRVTRAIAAHFVKRYGREEVATWWWESPNEGQLNWNAAGVGYWDAVTAGLADVDKRFAKRFGGPAAIYRKNPYHFVKLLESTPNIFTGKKEHTVGFISGHIKEPATEMVDSEIGMIKKINAEYPRYKDIPFVNTEHDPWNGWGRKHDWAGGPRFASWMANAVYQGQLRIIEQLGQPYFCSNDNGFLGTTWKQRTQMVLFRKGDRFALIKKPAHTVFTALAKLGNVRLQADGLPDVRSGMGVLATRNTNANGQIAVIAFNDGQPDRKLTVALKDLPKREWMLSHLRVDANTSNPIRVWSKDDIPSEEVLSRLREEMELTYAKPLKKVGSQDGTIELELELSRHSVSLLLLTPKPDKSPKAVRQIRVDALPGLYGPEHLLTWKGSNSSALYTYEVLHADKIDGEYRRLNKADLLCTAWTGPAHKGGYYRIRAVDVWGQKSESEPAAVD